VGTRLKSWTVPSDLTYEFCSYKIKNAIRLNDVLLFNYLGSYNICHEDDDAYTCVCARVRTVNNDQALHNDVRWQDVLFYKSYYH
jgi:hypothetical protein